VELLLGERSPWLVRWANLVAPGGRVLDLAAGSGRHCRWLAARGHAMTAVDRDAAAMAALGDVAETIVADLEAGAWPLPGRSFDAVVVTNYLWRPLFPAIVAATGPGGVLIYETFASEQPKYGHPHNPDYLLQPGELADWFQDWQIIHYFEGLLEDPRRAMAQIVCRKPHE